MFWAIQAVVGASDVVPYQYLDAMESIYATIGKVLMRWAPPHYFSHVYSRIFNDIIFGEVCLNRFNRAGVNYDFLSTASRLWSLYLAGVVEVFVDILFIWKIRDRTFSRVSLSYPIWKTRSLGECMGWTKRAIWWLAIIAPLKDIIGYGPWGRATNK